MEPAIHYARSSDGTHIAYYRTGGGDPVAFLPMLPLSHLQVERHTPSLRSFLDWFASFRLIVRYDARGTGLSENALTDRSLDAHVADLKAVLDALGIENTALFAASYAGPIALAFAGRYPERVSRLALWSTHARFADVARKLSDQRNEQRSAVIKLAAVDWSLAIHTYIHHAVGWSAGDEAQELAQLAIKTQDPTKFFQAVAQYAEFDATADLPNIKAPTLILHRPAFHGSHIDVARGLAARISDSQLVPLEGSSILPFVGDYEAMLRALADFLGAGDAVPRTISPTSETAESSGRLRTMLFTDLESHTAMMSRLGDARGRGILREYERITRKALASHGGSEVKSLGDGFLASFVSAQKALECAISLQRAFAEFNQNAEAENPDWPGLRVRVGVNAGEPIEEDGDLFGTSVIAASRIAAAACGGEILVADVVRQLVAGKGFLFASRDEVVLRGLEDPVRLHELRWQP